MPFFLYSGGIKLSKIIAVVNQKGETTRYTKKHKEAILRETL